MASEHHAAEAASIADKESYKLVAILQHTIVDSLAATDVIGNWLHTAYMMNTNKKPVSDHYH